MSRTLTVFVLVSFLSTAATFADWPPDCPCDADADGSGTIDTIDMGIVDGCAEFVKPANPEIVGHVPVNE